MRHRRIGRPETDGAAGSDDFEVFVARSMRPLTRAAILITWNLADAEDVVQEALYRTARHWGRVRAMENPYAYARRVVIHRALRGAEKRATLRRELYGWPEGMLAEEPGEASDDFSAVEMRLDLAAMLGALPPRQRAVVALRFAEQLTEAEVAEVLGWPLGTVKSTSARALDRLRSEHRARPDILSRTTPQPRIPPSLSDSSICSSINPRSRP